MGLKYSDHSDSEILLIYIVRSFINLANLASCSRVLCTGSDTAQIEKA